MTSVDVRIGPRGGRPEPPRPRQGRARWHAIANAVVLGWLALTALTAAGQAGLPAPRWLALHVFLLGAVTNAIVTWTEHFAVALLRLAEPPARWRAGRLVALNAGVVAVLTGASTGPAAAGVAGAAVVVAVVAAHVIGLLVWSRGALGGRFAHVVAWYVWAGAALVAGGALGGLMLSGHVTGAAAERLIAAHAHANLLGWVGLAVLGTLFTLWPTVLRTQVADGVGRIARMSVRGAVPGLALTVGALLAGARWLAALGLLLYATAAALTLVPFLRTARRRPPHTAAAFLLAAGTAWFVMALIADLAVVATRPPEQVPALIEGALPSVLAGFAGQTLIGALTFLLPVVLGGGPAALKRNAALLDRFWRVRLAAGNLGLAVTALPVPGPVRTAGWAVVVATLAAFVALAVAAVARSRNLQISPAAGGVATGVLTTMLAVAVGVAVTTTGGTGPRSHTVAGGGVQTVDITLIGMSVVPSVIEAPAGTRLVLRVTNKDTQRHDLRLDTGRRTPMLRGGESATLTLPELTRPVDGWCTVAGHRAAGMTLRINVAGAAPQAVPEPSAHAPRGSHPPGHDARHGPLNLAAPMSPGWRPYDATLRPAPGGTEHKIEIRAVETEAEVAPGVRQRVWTFGGTVPGPVLRGKVGDVFTITFVNDGTMGHGIDFHAGSLAPDRPMRTIEPGERLTYRFKAEHAGAWLYHCSTMPMLQHIANGMYGAVIIDPPGLPPVDREYVLVQGELYLGEPGDPAQVAKMREGRPDGWMFNGAAAQYDHAPLAARAGERVRVWVVAAGPASGTAFHIVGTRFDTVYKEGAYLLRPGGDGASQVLDLAAAQGGFVETVFPEPGRYPFVDHDMRRGEAGAHGFFQVAAR